MATGRQGEGKEGRILWRDVAHRRYRYFKNITWTLSVIHLNMDFILIFHTHKRGVGRGGEGVILLFGEGLDFTKNRQY